MRGSSFTVLVVADAVLPVPPKGYGGTERVVDLLCRGLSKRGFRVRLLGHEDSSTQATVVPFKNPNNKSKLSRVSCKVAFFIKLIRELRGANVVHAFGRPDYLLPALQLSDKPSLLTFSNPIQERQIRWILSKRSKNLLFTSVSDAQRLHVSQIGRWHTVYNALDLDRLSFSADPSRTRYLAFLGRLMEGKGAHIAIDVALASGLDIVLAGNVPDNLNDQSYFKKFLAPRLSNKSVHWIGEVDDAGKQKLLEGAVASLFPLLWDEPFGLTMIESLACGTPIIAFRKGSAEEIVRDGINGFLVEDADEMTEAIKRLDSIDRRACRADVELRFSADAMVTEYEKLYLLLQSNQAS